MEFEAALAAHYDTDAHFTPSVLYLQGKPLPKQPRLTKQALRTIRGEEADVFFNVIAIDVDGAGSDEWFDSDRLLWPSWTGAWYRTAGGYRLLWQLPELYSVERFVSLLTNLLRFLHLGGLDPDRLIDWTRCYRLPFVCRDGVDQRLAADLNLTTLPVSEIPEYDIAVARETVHLDGPIASGERNDSLFRGVAARLRNLSWMPDTMYLPILRQFNEVYCSPALSEPELAVIADSVMRYPKPEREHSKIVLKRGGLWTATEESIRVLAEGCDKLFVRDGQLVWLNEGGEWPRIEDISRAALRGLMQEYIDFVVLAPNGEGGYIEKRADCPKDLVEMLDAQNSYPGIRELESILTCPTITSEGDIISTDGYHVGLKAIMRSTVSLIPVAAPLVALNDLLRDFPFQNDHHKSTALCAIITPVVRAAIEGPVPLIVIDSTTPGSGKSLIADIVSTIVTGAAAPRMVWTKEEEVEKRITSLLSAGVHTVLIDNADTPVGGAALDALLTSNVWLGRVLGRSEMLCLRSRAQWMVTGNNVQISGDLVRRSIRCFLDPGVENPEQRDDFKYTNILKHVRDSRSLLVSSIIELVSRYMKTSKKLNVRAMGSFESWSEIVREAVIHAGLADPLGSQVELRLADTSSLWGQFMDSATAIWGDAWFTSKDVYEAAFSGLRVGGPREAYEGLRMAVEELLGSNTGIKSIAWLLKKWERRIVRASRLVRNGERHRMKGYLYRVEDSETFSEDTILNTKTLTGMQ